MGERFVDWVSECWWVFSQSTRTQVVLAVGLVLGAGLYLLGPLYVATLVFPWPLDAAGDALRQLLTHRVDKAALAILAMTVFAAIRTYRRDKRRLFDQL